MWVGAYGTNIVLHMNYIGKFSELGKTEKAETFHKRSAHTSEEK